MKSLLLCLYIFMCAISVESQATEAHQNEQQAVSIHQALNSLAKQSPALIFGRNLSHANQMLDQIEREHPAYKIVWEYLRAYYSFKTGHADLACNLVQKLSKPTPSFMNKAVILLTTEILIKHPFCSLIINENLIETENAFSLKFIDEVIYKNYLHVLVSQKKWDLLDAQLVIHEKSKQKQSDKQAVFLKTMRGIHLINTSNQPKAHKIFKELLIKEAGSPLETEIFIELESSGQKAGNFLNKEEWLKRSQVLIEKGYPLIAKNIIHAFKAQLTELEFVERMAHCHFSAKLYTEASQDYQKLIHLSPHSTKKSQWTAKLAQTYARSNQFDKAIELYSSSSGLKSEQRNSRLAFLYFDAGQYEKALFLLEKAVLDPKKSKEAFWLRFWSHYFLKNYKQALEVLNKSSDKSQPKLTYWKARLNEKLGQINVAKELYESLIPSNQPQYYSYLASHRLRQSSWDSKAMIDLQSIEVKTRDKPDYKRLPGESLENVFVYLFSQIVGINPGLDFSTSIQDPLHYYFEGNYSRLSGIGTTYLKVRPPSFTSQAYYWAYPLAYKNWVYFYSPLVGIHPFLSLSIMKQESGFRPTVSSPALALGLMQIIPQTSRVLAHELNIKSFHHEDLNFPDNNIRLGTYYLKKRMQEFNFNLPYVIASYNAGEKAVERWRAQGDKMEPDEFIEQIPYAETQDYVKKVLANFWTYLSLYAR